MLFRWIRLHLVFCHFQCLNQTFTGLSRIDDFVDESQLGSLIRSGELFLVGFQFFRLSLCIRFAEPGYLPRLLPPLLRFPHLDRQSLRLRLSAWSSSQCMHRRKPYG